MFRAIAPTVLTLLAGCAAPSAAIFRVILDRQAEAWNRGDIDGFMQDYWQSEELTFSSGGSTQQGWNATRDRYRVRYPTKTEMGTLRFALDRTQVLGGDAALVLGQWDLDRAAGPIGGNFSLVFRFIDGRWVIIHDHTSVRQSSAPTSGPSAAAIKVERALTAGCALCIFKMSDVKDCRLAARIEGRDYLVEGSGIDDHGDAHAPDGLCNKARPGRAVGVVRDGRFHVEKLTLEQ